MHQSLLVGSTFLLSSELRFFKLKDILLFFKVIFKKKPANAHPKGGGEKSRRESLESRDKDGGIGIFFRRDIFLRDSAMSPSPLCRWQLPGSCGEIERTRVLLFISHNKTDLASLEGFLKIFGRMKFLKK